MTATTTETQKNLLGRTNAGYEIIAVRPASLHPGDWYLFVVLGQMDDQYVTWTYNSQADGFATGHYLKTAQEAMNDFCTR